MNPNAKRMRYPRRRTPRPPERDLLTDQERDDRLAKLADIKRRLNEKGAS